MFALGNAMFACGVRSAREWSFEEVRGETGKLEDAYWCRYANQIPSWTSLLRRRCFAWNWTIPVVMLTTVVTPTATLSSNSCNSTIVFFLHIFTSVLSKQFAKNDIFSQRSELLQPSARVKKLAADSLPVWQQFSVTPPVDEKATIRQIGSWLVGWWVFNGTFSTNRLYPAVQVKKFITQSRKQDKYTIKQWDNTLNKENYKHSSTWAL